jgi:predicted DNA-binding WGR domain protein
MSDRTWPKLYKRNNQGKILEWSVAAQGNRIVTSYGQVGGKIQTTSDEVPEGKNLGRSNATTPAEQAASEAEASWTKQKKRGYVEDEQLAAEGGRDELITGGVDPMLAHHYMDVIYDLRPGGGTTYEKSKDAKKIKFPCQGQPKLDGIRCLAVKEDDGSFSLWTRTRKPITSCPHIEREMARLYAGAPAGTVVDGELYNHAYKRDFEKIASAVRKDEPTPESELVQYHVYDVASAPSSFSDRLVFNASFIGREDGIVHLVETIHVQDEDAVVPLFEKFVADGVEGLMLRNSGSLYVGKRSYDLQKAKPFQDDEFCIVGFTEGRGKLKGRLGTWICKTSDGDVFETAMNGEQEKLEEYFLNGASYVGQLLTVRFQGRTGARKVPRFPKGHSIRDYE